MLEYATAVLRVYYPDEASLAEDQQLQAFITYLDHVAGYPTPDEIDSAAALARIAALVRRM